MEKRHCSGHNLGKDKLKMICDVIFLWLLYDSDMRCSRGYVLRDSKLVLVVEL